MQQAISIIHNRQILRGMEHIRVGEKTPAVILFHGFTGTKLEPHRLFLKISRALEDRGIASFRFDFLGSGESDGHFEDMTVLNELEEAKTIFDFVKSHPLVDEDRIVVLGFSMGGLVASLLAGHLQDHLQKLILLAPAGNMSEKAKDMEKQAAYIESKDAYDIGGNLIGKPFIEELQSIEVWQQAAKYQKDVLLIHGTEDKSVPFEVSKEYIDKCYGEKASLISIDGADHTYNSYEWEEKVILEICKFLSKQSV